MRRLYACCQPWQHGRHDGDAKEGAEAIDEAMPPSEDQQLRLPGRGEAQATQPLVLRGLLGLDEIELVRGLGAQLPSRWKRGHWATHFLHAGGTFNRGAPELLNKLMDAACHADASDGGWGLLRELRDPERLQARCVEHHIVGPGGCLPDPHHSDEGSLLTIDVMLSRPGVDFEGGEFCTLEGVGEMREHEFSQGDALVFVSHKCHSVKRVRSGQREVLVMEIWEGEERHCNHRCDRHWGPCAGEITKNQVT